MKHVKVISTLGRTLLIGRYKKPLRDNVETTLTEEEYEKLKHLKEIKLVKEKATVSGDIVETSGSPIDLKKKVRSRAVDIKKELPEEALDDIGESDAKWGGIKMSKDDKASLDKQLEYSKKLAKPTITVSKLLAVNKKKFFELVKQVDNPKTLEVYIAKINGDPKKYKEKLEAAGNRLAELRK